MVVKDVVIHLKIFFPDFVRVSYPIYILFFDFWAISKVP